MKIKTRQELEAKKSGVRSFFKDAEKADLNLCGNRMWPEGSLNIYARLQEILKEQRHQMFSGIRKRNMKSVGLKKRMPWFL